MRVLHLISSAGLYGAEKMVVGLCRRLADEDVAATLEVFHNRHLPNLEAADYARDHGVRVRLLDCRGRFDPLAVRQLRRDIRAEGVDVVHTHGFKSNLYGFLASRRGAARFVSTCHRFDQTLRDTLDRPVLRRADLVTAVSQEAGDSVRSEYGLPADRVLVIPNGVPVPAAPAPPLFARKGGAVVAMAARLAPEKAPQDFLHAAALVAGEHPDTRFLIAGDGPLLTELTALRTELGLDDVVRLPGFVADMPRVYASVDVLVQPSYREGMPMTLLEAMAAGVAVVATRVGAAPDFIRDGETGLLVDPGDVAGLADRVGQLVGDPALRAALAQAGRDDVRQHHSDAAMAAAYARAYRSLPAA